MTQTVTSIKIRRATSDDAATLAELGWQTFDETFAEFNKPEDMKAYLEEAFTVKSLAQELADERARFFIAEAEGEAAGYAKLYLGDAPACVAGESPIELARLYVLRKYLGCGAGAALMQKFVEEARSLGRKTLWLGVWEHNERAKAFYRKWNFREVGAHEFILGSDVQTDWVMQTELKD